MCTSKIKEYMCKQSWNLDLLYLYLVCAWDYNASTSILENLQKDNPGITIKNLGRVLGDRWNKLSGS
ncbi:hypothetical protein L6452_15501 [Arctium lappa]|uniref:Uncharacterized protein n=1 Tax=Arctium lappa TaxID=4217 RepID=A0ACB9CP18_ARCLA|nr:hypothetical protein L6452_15501 [Arctium lappa]